MWSPKSNWGTGAKAALSDLAASTDQMSWIIAMVQARSEDTVKEGVGKVHKPPRGHFWSMSIALAGSKSRQRSSEFCCLFSISRGQSLLCFSSLWWKGCSLKCSWFPRTALEATSWSAGQMRSKQDEFTLPAWDQVVLQMLEGERGI